MHPAWCLPRQATAAAGHFSPSWFTASMSTGVVALCLANFPYHLPAKLDLGWAVWWLNTALFLLFATLLLSRCLLAFKDCVKLLGHPVQPLYLGAIPMALATIVNGIPLFLVPRWGGHTATAALVLWAVDAAAAGTCVLLLPLYLFIHHQHSLGTVSGAWLLPVIPGVVASASGGIVAQACSSAGTARHVIIACIVLWGLTMPLAFILITSLFQRMAFHSLPPSEVIVSVFIPMGPLAMAAEALLHLRAARQRAAGLALAALAASSPHQPSLASALDPGPSSVGQAAALGSPAVVAALALWAAAAWWLVAAAAMVLSSVRALPFNMGWWSLVFPLGVFTLAAEHLSQPNNLDSEAFRITGAGLAALTVAAWAGVGGHTLYHVLMGTLKQAPSLL